MALVLKSEIAAIFTRTLTESRIPTDLPGIVEYKYIRPILGKDFYDAVVTTPASYTALLVYVKPVICWYAKYMLMPELRFELSDLGVNSIQINGTTPITDEAYATAMNQCLIMAEEKVKMLNDYLYDNADLYPLYYKSQNSSENCQISGGIIMKKKNINSIDNGNY